MDKLIVGSKVPEFNLKDHDGKEFGLGDILGKKNIVIYFYPKNETPGCTKEACSFRDSYEEFINSATEVIGISSDSPESHASFKANHHLPFTLLSDPGDRIRKKFGVPKSFLGLVPGRVTYVIDKKGIVRHIFNSQIMAQRHVKEALEALEEIRN